VAGARAILSLQQPAIVVCFRCVVLLLSRDDAFTIQLNRNTTKKSNNRPATRA
jgi:hypothetical protein